jgi:hypothetical protein
LCGPLLSRWTAWPPRYVRSLSSRRHGSASSEWETSLLLRKYEYVGLA